MTYVLNHVKYICPNKTSLYYSGLLFGKFSPQVFYCKISLFHWFS